MISIDELEVQDYGYLRTFNKITVAPDRKHLVVSNYAAATCWKLGRKEHLWKIGTSEAGRSHDVHFGKDWVLLHEKGETTAARPAIVRSLDNLLAPAPDQTRVAFLKGQPYAHRGLHGNGALENSPAAFEAAIKLGHGIECDVQAAEDGRAFVFHDYELDRLTFGARVPDRDCLAIRAPSQDARVAGT